VIFNADISFILVIKETNEKEHVNKQLFIYEFNIYIYIYKCTYIIFTGLCIKCIYSSDLQYSLGEKQWCRSLYFTLHTRRHFLKAV
jgi:hypothetical protein